MAKPSNIKNLILELRKQNKSYREIQKQLGCSKGTISYHLGEGQKDRTKSNTKKQREKVRTYVQNLKEETPCKDCNMKYPYWIMQFDHLRDKKIKLSHFHNNTTSFKKIKEEIEKCDIVCSNCHHNRTYLRRKLGALV